MGEAGGAEETCRVSVGAGPPAFRGPGLWRPPIPHAEPHRSPPRPCAVCPGGPRASSADSMAWTGDGGRRPQARKPRVRVWEAERWAVGVLLCLLCPRPRGPVAGSGLSGLTVARLSQPPHVVAPERGVGVGRDGLWSRIRVQILLVSPGPGVPESHLARLCPRFPAGQP